MSFSRAIPWGVSLSENVKLRPIINYNATLQTWLNEIWETYQLFKRLRILQPDQRWTYDIVPDSGGRDIFDTLLIWYV